MVYPGYNSDLLKKINLLIINFSMSSRGHGLNWMLHCALNTHDSCRFFVGAAGLFYVYAPVDIVLLETPVEPLMDSYIM